MVLHPDEGGCETTLREHFNDGVEVGASVERSTEEPGARECVEVGVWNHPGPVDLARSRGQYLGGQATCRLFHHLTSRPSIALIHEVIEAALTVRCEWRRAGLRATI